MSLSCCAVGGDVPAAAQLPGPVQPDRPHPVQAPVVRHAGAVPHEVRVERLGADHGGRTHHNCHRILQAR